jgi:hypothetical protein
MPTLRISGLPAALAARLTAYAARVGLGRAEAAVSLIDAGLRAHERAVKAGEARAAHVTPEQQRATAQQRWRRVTAPEGE